MLDVSWMVDARELLFSCVAERWLVVGVALPKGCDCSAEPSPYGEQAFPTFWMLRRRHVLEEELVVHEEDGAH